ncbi:hypothetical protein R1sor_009976 [Riccia sorocarpa]|uniref:Uncharacterized protein n=1 Tax=Riccia sorocarpa TaxID=122646 RepID=A0ABD3I0M8_9MARC
MVRVILQLVLLVALTAVMVSPPVVSAYSHHHLRRPGFPAFRYRGTGVLCIGEVAELLSTHEGRHHTAYDHPGGWRAVGCGYNLDQDADQRRKELEEAGLDYDRVYKGDQRLNHMQISGLLILDAKRALDRAGENIKRLDDFCCSMKAVFADIQHTAGSTEKFPRQDIEEVINKVADQDWEKAADELERTEWCSKKHHRFRCDHNLEVLEKGC